MPSKGSCNTTDILVDTRNEEFFEAIEKSALGEGVAEYLRSKWNSQLNSSILYKAIPIWEAGLLRRAYWTSKSTRLPKTRQLTQSKEAYRELES